MAEEEEHPLLGVLYPQQAAVQGVPQQGPGGVSPSLLAAAAAGPGRWDPGLLLLLVVQLVSVVQGCWTCSSVQWQAALLVVA